MKSITLIAAATVLALSSTLSWANSTTVFKGRPTVKVIEGGVNRVAEKLETNKASNLKCVISRIGETYYWTSRENTKLVRLESGAFTTYLATNGAGYVRVVNPTTKAAASLMSETEAEFDYVEHALIGLRSVTHRGKPPALPEDSKRFDLCDGRGRWIRRLSQ